MTRLPALRPGAVAIVAAWGLLIALTFVALRRPGALSIGAIVLAFLVAFAGRGIASNLVNGVWLRRSGVVESGHYIRLEGPADVEGYVQGIGLRTTVLQTPSGDAVRIPNATLGNSIFTSFHADPAGDAITVDVEADINVSPRRIVEVLHQEARSLARSGPDVIEGSHRVQQLPGRFPGCRRFIMRCRVRGAEHRDQVQDELDRRVAERLRRENIPIPTLSPRRGER